MLIHSYLNNIAVEKTQHLVGKTQLLSRKIPTSGRKNPTSQSENPNIWSEKPNSVGKTQLPVGKTQHYIFLTEITVVKFASIKIISYLCKRYKQIIHLSVWRRRTVFPSLFIPHDIFRRQPVFPSVSRGRMFVAEQYGLPPLFLLQLRY